MQYDQHAIAMLTPSLYT